MDITEAKRLFDLHELTQSVDVLDRLIGEDQANIPALLLRGKIFYKMQRWGDAMNDFAVVLDFDPNNKEAKTGLEMAKGILAYYTPDMFNP
jgi:tetratricopeptide (TPR) repeat protein